MLRPLVALMLSSFPLAGLAQNASPACVTPDGTAACASVIAPGQIAVIDPATGQVLSGEAAEKILATPGEEEFIRTLNDQIAAQFSGEGLVEERTSTGAVALSLNGRFQSPLVATVAPDGHVETWHPVGPSGH